MRRSRNAEHGLVREREARPTRANPPYTPHTAIIHSRGKHESNLSEQLQLIYQRRIAYDCTVTLEATWSLLNSASIYLAVYMFSSLLFIERYR